MGSVLWGFESILGKIPSIKTSRTSKRFLWCSEHESIIVQMSAAGFLGAIEVSAHAYMVVTNQSRVVNLLMLELAKLSMSMLQNLLRRLLSL